MGDHFGRPDSAEVKMVKKGWGTTSDVLTVPRSKNSQIVTKVWGTTPAVLTVLRSKCSKLVIFERFRLREWQHRVSHEELLRVDGVNLSGDLVVDLSEIVKKGWGTTSDVLTVPR